MSDSWRHRRLVFTCSFCRREVDPNSPTVWRRVQGWERKAQGETRRGGSDIVLREYIGGFAFACNECVEKKRLGLSEFQMELT